MSRQTHEIVCEAKQNNSHGQRRRTLKVCQKNLHKKIFGFLIFLFFFTCSKFRLFSFSDILAESSNRENLHNLIIKLIVEKLLFKFDVRANMYIN